MRNRVGDQSSNARSTSPMSQEEGGVNLQAHNSQTENTSLFAAFKRLISDAISSVFSAISRAFSNPRNADIATRNIRHNINPPQPTVIIKEPDPTPRTEYVARPIFATNVDSEENKKNKLEQGKEQFLQRLNNIKEPKLGSHSIETNELHDYAQTRFDEYRENKKNNPNYSLTIEQQNEIKIISEILNTDETKLLPDPKKIVSPENPILTRNKNEKAEIGTIENPPIQKSPPHPGEEPFLNFYNEFKETKIILDGLAKADKNPAMLDFYSNDDCIAFARDLVNPNSVNKKINEKNQSELKREAKRAEKKEINSGSEKKIVPFNENIIGELAGKDNNLYAKKSDVLFSDSFELIPKEDRAVLANKLNYFGSKVDMAKLSSGLKVLKEYKTESEAPADFSADDIACLHEVFTFINLLKPAYDDPNGNPIKAHGFGGGRIFKDDHTEGILEKIHTNRDEIGRVIGEILSKNNIAEADNPMISSPLPIPSLPLEKPPAALSDAAGNAVSVKPLPPAPPPMPPGLMQLPSIPPFPEIVGSKVNQIYEFLYPDKSLMPINYFRTEFFNFAAVYFGVSPGNPDYEFIKDIKGKHKAATDAFAVQWMRADRSRIPTELQEFVLVELYVKNHLEKNPELSRLI
jgi:hypothetical protein